MWVRLASTRVTWALPRLQGAAETGGELQPAGAAADDHDAMGHVDIS